MIIIYTEECAKQKLVASNDKFIKLILTWIFSELIILKQNETVHIIAPVSHFDSVLRNQ